jgi:competence protein ComGC
MTGTIAVIMIFSIPIIAIFTDHIQKQSKIKQKMLEDQLKLEQLKHENFVIETEKMKLELHKMNLEEPKNYSHVL